MTAEKRQLASSVAVLFVGLSVFTSANYAQTSAPTRPAAEDRTIRPFKVEIPQAALDDLRRRISATRWPDRETVDDRSQGTQLAKLQELVRYWGTDHDWRKIESRLNELPQFITTIDGLDIHFIHVRSRHPDALPVIITHGWPGSITEQLKVIGPLKIPLHMADCARRLRYCYTVDARLWLFRQADKTGWIRIELHKPGRS